MASGSHQNHPVAFLLYLSFQVFMNILSVQTTFYVWGLRDKLSLGMEFLCLLPQPGNLNYTRDSLVVVFMKRISCLMCSHNFLNRNCFTLDIIANFTYSTTALNLFSRKYIVCMYGFIYTYKYMQKNLSHRGRLSAYT